LNCRKCGAALRKEQKVCIACGTLTPAGGNFYVEEGKRWIPTPKQKYAAGGVVLLLVILLIAHLMRTVPPEIVAQQWFDALVSRNIRVARQYVTPDLEQNLQDQMMDLRAISDDYYTRVVVDQAKYEVAKPAIESPTKATVMVKLIDPEGSGYQVCLDMIKQGRCWRVNKIR